MCPFICKHLGATSGQLCKPSPAECNLSLGQVEGRAGPGCFIHTQDGRARRREGGGERGLLIPPSRKTGKEIGLGLGPR